jgi:peroxiredoxin
MIKTRYIKTAILFLTSFSLQQSHGQTAGYVATLKRTDGLLIPFSFQQQQTNRKIYWVIKNGAEKIKVDNIIYEGDSVLIQMPVFESQFRLAKKEKGFEGVWIKNGSVKASVLPFTAKPGNKKFGMAAKTAFNISGRWAVKFTGAKNGDISVAEFVQKGNLLTGTFLNATGDYRYLEGTVKSDSMFLSAFDGGHAFLFTAKIENNTTISNGVFYSGAVYKEEWTAVKDATAKVPAESVAMFIKPGEESLHFTFKNLEGNPVSINDEKFKNKVVIIQLMGSWCPNCMDETAFLSEYYNKNKQRGIEVIAMAYEYSTNWERSIKSLKKFQQRYNVQYEILNTEVTVSDSLRTEKTLPEVTPIKFFPSSIILDKKGKIRKLDTGFNGPATGEHHLAYKKELEELIDKLLRE